MALVQTKTLLKMTLHWEAAEKPLEIHEQVDTTSTEDSTYLTREYRKSMVFETDDVSTYDQVVQDTHALVWA